MASINTIVATGKGRGKERAVAGVYAAIPEFMPNAAPTTSKQQSARNDRKGKPYPSRNWSNPNLIYDNTHCLFPVGHTRTECFVYGGGKVGQYPPNFRGQKDLDLSPEARAASRRKSAIEKAKADQSRQQERVGMAEEGDPSRHAVSANYRQATEEEVNEVLGQVADSFAFMMEVEGETVDKEDKIKFDEEVHINAVALNVDTPQDNSINHDTGATRHIFCNRRLFHDYAILESPLNMHSFGSKLSAVAIGKGTIVLKVKFGGSLRNFLLSNVLHIPSARCNLISGSKIDKKGVST